MEKLISMSAFVLEHRNPLGFKSEMERLRYYDTVYNNYARFLSKPLTLGMFVPVDEDGEFLTAPTYFVDGDKVEFQQRELEYENARSSVLFEGFIICNRLESVKCVVNEDLHLSYDKAIERKETIENLTKYSLTLTESAKKQIFG